MQMRVTLLFAAALLGLAPGAAGADEFTSEAAAAITSNPALAAERARVMAVRQSMPVAWSELLPQVSAEASAISQDSTEQRLALNIREQPEYWIATLRVSTLLFAGGRVFATTRQARADITSAIAQYQDAVQNLALEFTQAYANARLAREVLAAQEQSLANLEEQVRFARANQREGFLTRTDVAQAEARVAAARADLARARANIVQADEAYARIVGHQPGELSEPARLAGLPTSLEGVIEASEEHPALIAAAANWASSDAAVDLAASNGRLRLFLESTNSTYDTIEPGRFSQEFDRTVSVRASIPLFSGGSNRARESQRRHLRTASRYELDDAQRRVRENVVSAWSGLEAAHARLDASQARLEAAELASQGVRREQQFGQRSMIDVLNQEQERLSARVGRAEAERDLIVAERSLAAASGMIAALLGVEARPALRAVWRPQPEPLDNDEP